MGKMTRDFMNKKQQEKMGNVVCLFVLLGKTMTDLEVQIGENYIRRAFLCVRANVITN